MVFGGGAPFCGLLGLGVGVWGCPHPPVSKVAPSTPGVVGCGVFWGWSCGLLGLGMAGLGGGALGGRGAGHNWHLDHV